MQQRLRLSKPQLARQHAKHTAVVWNRFNYRTNKLEMELFLTPSHYIVKDAASSLWCCRETGTLEARPATWIDGSLNPVCLGSLEGVVGRVQYHPESEWRLLLITQTSYKGDLPGNHRVRELSLVDVYPEMAMAYMYMSSDSNDQCGSKKGNY